MKNAIYYTFLFITVQFFTHIATVIIWLTTQGMPAARAIEMTLKGNALTTTPMLIVAQIIFSVLMLTIFIWRRYCEVSPQWLRTRQWQVLAWSLVATLGTIIPTMAFQELLPDIDEAQKQQLVGLASTQWGYVVMCICAPLLEEIVFRGAILKSLLKTQKTSVAIIVSALIFALVHGIPQQMPHAFLMGLLLGWMYWRTGSILPGLVVHWTNNTVTYAALHIAPSMANMKLIDLFGTTPRVWMAIGCSLLIVLPALLQLHINMHRTR